MPGPDQSSRTFVVDPNTDPTTAYGATLNGDHTASYVINNSLDVIRLLYGVTHTDLGPFRAISLTALDRLQMQDRNWGWTAEMQVKAIRRCLSVLEVPVS